MNDPISRARAIFRDRRIAKGRAGEASDPVQQGAMGRFFSQSPRAVNLGVTEMIDGDRWGNGSGTPNMVEKPSTSGKSTYFEKTPIVDKPELVERKNSMGSIGNNQLMSGRGFSEDARASAALSKAVKPRFKNDIKPR